MRFLIEFAHQHLDFQLPELQAVLNLCGINSYETEELPSPQTPSHRSFLIVSFASNDATIGSKLYQQATLIKRVVELFGTGASLDDCLIETQRYLEDPAGKGRFESNSGESWKLSVHTFGSKHSQEEQNTMRDAFTKTIPFQGDVNLTAPDREFILIRETTVDANGSPFYIPETKTYNKEAIAYYFGHVLASGKDRGSLTKYSLKTRQYLGPTSMDAELSFIMTNLAKIKQGTYAYDPFVGTASILLSCALKGAVCVGSDIDIRVIKGKSKEETIWANFEQFDLPRPEIVRCDSSIYARHFRCETPIYDAIVTDPPYGIRAGAKRCGTRKEEVIPVQDKYRDEHIAQTKPYPVSEVMADLLDMSARTLVMGGRLVYIIPSYTDFLEDDLPRHECLKLIASCYQPLGEKLGRRVVCLEKCKEYNVENRESYLSNVWKNGPESANKCNDIRLKLQEEAAKRPGHETYLAFRRERRKALKEEKKAAKRQKAEEKDSTD